MSSTITGYYRFTDIFFEWHQVLPNPEDIGPLKALIAYDALVHPDHPLRKQGVNGIELFMGTFDNGEARLLFSSAQVEYMRYWLHAMQLTKEIIPLPSGDYLITQGSMLSCSPVVYKEAAVFKKAIRVIDRNNKRVKGAQPLLFTRRTAFERIRTFWTAKSGTWLAIDFEAWERDHTLLLEFGWSLVRWENGEEVSEDGHMIVKERQSFHNHTWVKGNKDHYQFGQSFKVDKKQFKANICELLARYQSSGPLFLVFHDPSQDIKYLRSKDIEAPLPDLTYILPESTPKTGIYVVDTGEMFAALEGSSNKNNQSLQTLCRRLVIPTEYLHNAGNDAHFTMLAAKAMASGDPVDDQREKRWPGLVTRHEPKIEFEGDSEMEDTEAVLGGVDPYEALANADGDDW